MSNPQRELVDQTFTPPPPPSEGQPWPGPTRSAYPLKPWDRILEDGQIVSGALGRIKHAQHEHRVVVEWRVDNWAVVRHRLVPPPWVNGTTGTTMSVLFQPEPGRWGLRGDPHVWTAMRRALAQTPIPGCAEDGNQLLDDTFRNVVGARHADTAFGDAIHLNKFDHGGMSGGQVHLETWLTKLMPLLKSRLQSALSENLNAADCAG